MRAIAIACTFVAMQLIALQHSAIAAPAPSTTRDAFDAASEKIANDPQGAATAFEALADAHPDDEYAPDALLEAAELAEEKLGHPDHALALYERLIARYPDSRLALRARARRDFLAPGLRTGAAPLAEYQDILLHYASRPPTESRARMAKLVAEHPDFALADRALLWLGNDLARDGRWDEAIARYAEVEQRYAGTAIADEAKKARADALLAAGRAGDAKAIYRALAGGADRNLAEAARRGVTAANRQLLRRGLFVGALAYLALFLALALRLAGRRLWPLPFELKYYLPIAALFALAALGAQPQALFAVLLIAGGGALITWLAGAAPRLGRLRRVSHAAATGLAVIALTYAALHTTRMIDVTLETLRYGPDR